MSQFIPYLVTGFLFCRVYTFVALKKTENESENIIIKSFVYGYIIYWIASIIPHGNISNKIYPIIITIVAIFVSYLLARFLTSKKSMKLFDSLRIGETGNDYLWDDIRDPDYGVIATVSYQDKIFEGYIHEYEAYTNSPHIVLCLYKVYDTNKNIIEDNSKDPSLLIMLDTAKANSVKMDYAYESVVTKDVSRYLQ